LIEASKLLASSLPLRNESEALLNITTKISFKALTMIYSGFDRNYSLLSKYSFPLENYEVFNEVLEDRAVNAEELVNILEKGIRFNHYFLCSVVKPNIMLVWFNLFTCIESYHNLSVLVYASIVLHNSP
jgi:hypothetical protein